MQVPADAQRVSLTTLVRRTASRIVHRTEVCNVNRETRARALDDDSIFRWHFRSFASKRERILAWEADPAMPPVVRFTRPCDLDAWLDRLAVGSAAQEAGVGRVRETRSQVAPSQRTTACRLRPLASSSNARSDSKSMRPNHPSTR